MNDAPMQQAQVYRTKLTQSFEYSSSRDVHIIKQLLCLLIYWTKKKVLYLIIKWFILLLFTEHFK